MALGTSVINFLRNALGGTKKDGNDKQSTQTKTSTPSNLPESFTVPRLQLPNLNQSLPVNQSVAPARQPTPQETRNARIQASTAAPLQGARFAKELSALPAISRNALSGLLTLQEATTGKRPEPIQATNPISKFLLNPTKDFEGIKSFQQRGEEAQATSQKLFGEGPAQRGLGIAGLVGLSALESIPGGSVGKKLITEGAETVAPKLAADVAGNIRLDKFDLPDDGKEMLRTIITENKDFTAQRRGVRSIEQTNKAAEEIIVNTRLAKGTALNADEIQALGNTTANLQNKVSDIARLISNGNNSDEVLANFELAKQELSFALGSLSGATSETGRTLRQIQEIKRAVGNKDVDLIRRIVNLSGGRTNAENAAKKLVDFGDDNLAKIKYIQQISKPGFANKAQELWLNSILASPMSQMANVTGNTLRALLNPVIKGTQATVEATRGKNREVFFGEVPEEVYGLAAGFGEGIRKGMFVMRNGVTEGAVDKLDITQRPAISGMFGEIVRTPTKLLAAADEFFKTMIGTSQLRALAYRQASKEGLKGKAFNTRLGELIENPTAKMLSDIDYRKLEGTYQTELGKYGQSILRFRRDVPGIKYIIPFITTPVNVLKDAVRTSPIGFVDIANKYAKNGFKNLPDNEGSRRIAQAALGSAITVFLVNEALDGNITGAAPQDAKERSTFYDVEGKQPYSVRIGDKWVSYRRLEPFATLFGSVADFTKLSKEEEIQDAAPLLWAAVANNLTDKTFMAGLSGFIEATNDPAKSEQWFSNLVGGFVPFSGTLRYVEGFTDPAMRQPDTVAERIKAQIPGVSEDVAPRRNVFGEMITPPPSQRFTPFGINSYNTNDPTVQALRDANIELGALPRTTNGIRLNSEEYNLYTGVAGKMFKKALDTVVQNPSWNQLTSNQKQELVEDLRSEINSQARAALFPFKSMKGEIEKQLEAAGVPAADVSRKAEEVVKRLEEKATSLQAEQSTAQN